MCPVIWLMVLAFWRLGTRLYTVSSILGTAEISGLGLSELQKLVLTSLFVSTTIGSGGSPVSSARWKCRQYGINDIKYIVGS